MTKDNWRRAGAAIFPARCSFLSDGGLLGRAANLRSPMNQPAILSQPARASAVTASTFLTTTSQLTIGFRSD
jgi:hypothetical protein